MVFTEKVEASTHIYKNDIISAAHSTKPICTAVQFKIIQEKISVFD